jgi:DNA-directed RNA polymerase specialized sigma24 family protein
VQVQCQMRPIGNGDFQPHVNFAMTVASHSRRLNSLFIMCHGASAYRRAPGHRLSKLSRRRPFVSVIYGPGVFNRVSRLVVGMTDAHDGICSAWKHEVQRSSRFAAHNKRTEGLIMKLATVLGAIRQRRRYVTHDNIRNVFGDYHNALHWLALFLVGDRKLAQACVIDACSIAAVDTPAFHEWLVHWAVRATFRSAFRKERMSVAELASKYERDSPLIQEQPPLLSEQFHRLIRHSELIHSRLDALCRFVLVMRGIAKDPYDEIAAQLGISRTAAKRAYQLAFNLIGDLPRERPGGAGVATAQLEEQKR